MASSHLRTVLIIIGKKSGELWQVRNHDFSVDGCISVKRRCRVREGWKDLRDVPSTVLRRGRDSLDQG